MKPNHRQTRKKRTYIAPEKVLIIKQIISGIIILSFLALLIFGVWHGTRVTSLTINSVEVDDGKTIPAQMIREVVDSSLVGEYWHLIPRRFAWFYPKDDLLKKLNEIERIKDVQIERVSGTKLKVTFAEHIPHALWCKKHEDYCYFINDKGLAFGEAPSLLGGSLIRYYKTDEEPQLQSKIANSDDFLNTKKFSEYMSDIGWYVKEIEIDSVGDVFYVLSGGSELRSMLRNDPLKTFSYFQTLISAKEFAHLQPDNFDYIDLRFGEKLYVNEGKVEGGVSTSTEIKESI